eukprot:1450331-Amphidinium_carterae.1
MRTFAQQGDKKKTKDAKEKIKKKNKDRDKGKKDKDDKKDEKKNKSDQESEDKKRRIPTMYDTVLPTCLPIAELPRDMRRSASASPSGSDEDDGSGDTHTHMQRQMAALLGYRNYDRGCQLAVSRIPWPCGRCGGADG